MTRTAPILLLAFLLAGPAWAETVNGSDFYVIDGDTVDIAGERIRIANIDAPEIGHFECEFEHQLGLAARDVLIEALKGQRVAITRWKNKDRYGRTLATLTTSAGDVGRVLVDAHAAFPWRAGAKAKAWRKAQWCGERR